MPRVAFVHTHSQSYVAAIQLHGVVDEAGVFDF